MEKYKNVIIVNAIVFVVLGLLMATSGMILVGALGVLQGSINLICALIVAVPGEKKHLVQGYLICGGVLLLIGFSLCSTFPLSFH
ncbi:hypothetical protein [Ferruginibacter sp. SUN106]|uniref:hypothetical protein n=1 Tax=Ferruginibacter sp. SUN106 TaxID=2978348 RepID=UPI003D36D0BD